MPTAEDLSSATAPLPPGTFTTSAHSDEWKIANAFSAGPTTITEHAAVMDWPVNPKDPIESALRDRAMPRSRWDTQVDRRRSYISIDERVRRAQAEAEQRSCHAGARCELGSVESGNIRSEPLSQSAASAVSESTLGSPVAAASKTKRWSSSRLCATKMIPSISMRRPLAILITVLHPHRPIRGWSQVQLAADVQNGARRRPSRRRRKPARRHGLARASSHHERRAAGASARGLISNAT